MNAGTKTAPSGATVPAAVRTAAEARKDREFLAPFVGSGPANAARDALYSAANVLMQQDETISALRAELRAKTDEVEALKRHIEQMAVLA